MIPFRQLVLVVALSAISTPCFAQLQTFEVGPSGHYSTVNAALTDLLTSPTDQNWIQIQSGVTTTESIAIPSSWTSGFLWISGGWDATFSSQSSDPTDTVVSGGLINRSFAVQSIGGTVLISDLSIIDGQVSAQGGGVKVDTAGPAVVRLTRLSIHNNVTLSTGTATSAGIYANLRDTSDLFIDECDVFSNMASGDSSAIGAGVYINAFGDNEIEITDTQIRENTAASDNIISGAGIYANLSDQSHLLIEDSALLGNTTSSSLVPDTEGIALTAVVDSLASLEIHRTRFDANVPILSDLHEQISVQAFSTAAIAITDSLIVNGASSGIYVKTSDSSTAYLTNLTVTRNDYRGLELNRPFGSSASIDLSNTISVGNTASDLSIHADTIGQVGNLIGVDPEFVDPEAGDFRFEVGSAATDAGSPTPPGGLGDGDLRGGLRTTGAAPDAGAYEGDVSLIFSDGFELDWSRHWSEVVGLPIF